MDLQDVVIVGGSVAGAALAIRLGRAGARTVILDKARFPRPKACGEGLLPHGVEALADLGLPEPPGLPVHAIRYGAADGGRAEARFSDAGLGPGRMVRREEFDAWLLGHARTTPNVEVREDAEVRHIHVSPEGVRAEDVRARILVGADGARSILHRLGPYVRTHPRRARTGLSMRVRGYAPGDGVDVFLGHGGEAYLGPGAGGETALAVLLERGIRCEDFLSSVPALRDVEPVTPARGAAPLGSTVTPLVAGPSLVVGDAAGAPDPVTGEGMSLALLSARAAASAILESLETRDGGRLAGYERERRRLAEPSERMGRLILMLARHPWLGNKAVRRLARDRGLFCRLLRYACGAEPLGLLEPVRLLL